MKHFDAWNKIKKQIEARPYGSRCKNGEIRWCCFGLNVGSEQDGKNELFERPVLVIKVINKDTVICIPLSSAVNTDRDGVEIRYEGKSSFALFQHVKTISTKRFTRKIARLSKEQVRSVMISYVTFLGFGKNETPPDTDGSLASEHLGGIDGESRVLFNSCEPKGII